MDAPSSPIDNLPCHRLKWIRSCQVKLRQDQWGEIMKENGKLRTIDKTDLFRLKFLESGQLSPDGKYIVYSVGEVHTQDDGKDEQKRSALWLMRLETGDARQLTNGQARDLY